MKITLEKIDIAESKIIPFLGIEDMKMIPENKSRFTLHFCLNDERKDIATSFDEIIFEYNDGELYFCDGRGCVSSYIAFRIDTSQKGYTSKIEKLRGLSIDSHKHHELDLLFDPDKSCSFNMKVYFRIISKGTKQYWIERKLENIELFVSSIDYSSHEDNDFEFVDNDF